MIFIFYLLYSVTLFQLLCSIIYWWPELVVPIWFTGGTLMFGFVILYADKTLKNTAEDIEKLKGFMYSFKKL